VFNRGGGTDWNHFGAHAGLQIAPERFGRFCCSFLFLFPTSFKRVSISEVTENSLFLKYIGYFYGFWSNRPFSFSYHDILT
jgi:hypothetical protein